jgi:hypothetical protein
MLVTKDRPESRPSVTTKDERLLRDARPPLYPAIPSFSSFRAFNNNKTNNNSSYLMLKTGMRV